MKKIVFLGIVLLSLALLSLISSCGTTKASPDQSNDEKLDITEEERIAFSKTEGDTISISNDEVSYEIIIIEPGFNFWLQSVARQKGYYSQSFLENRNRILVVNWNIRVNQPQIFDPNLYQLEINYRPDIDYGYEVNYKLYNYFIFFQRKFNQRLGPFIPRI